MTQVLDMVIRAPNAVIGNEIRSAAIGVAGAVISAVGPADAAYRAARELRLSPSVVLMPGLVDTHVHLNDPGTDWEGFTTGTAAAAAGGVTTLVDMPLDCSPVTTSVAALDVKRAAAQGNCRVDVGFWGGVVPGNLTELAALADAGCLGFKCFLADSGNPEFPALPEHELVGAMATVAELGAVMLVHAECGEHLHPVPVDGGDAYTSFLRSRPDRAETSAVQAVVDAVRQTGARAHIVHVSSAQVLPLIAAAKAEGLPVTAETCPHYLIFDSGQIADGATEFAACPPIRDAANRELLWEGLRSGVLDMVVSDHSPCAPGMKNGGFAAAFGGISSLQLGLRAVFSGALDRGFTLADIGRWMAQRPAALAGLDDRGRIAAGLRADFCVVDPEAAQTVEAASLHHRHPVTPYDGMTLRGQVVSTWLGGAEIGDDRRGELLGTRHAGQQVSL